MTPSQVRIVVAALVAGACAKTPNGDPTREVADVHDAAAPLTSDSGGARTTSDGEVDASHGGGSEGGIGLGSLLDRFDGGVRAGGGGSRIRNSCGGVLRGNDEGLGHAGPRAKKPETH